MVKKKKSTVRGELMINLVDILVQKRIIIDKEWEKFFIKISLIKED